MLVHEPVKKAVLDTAVVIHLHTKNISRSARNLIELGCTLSNHQLNSEEYDKDYIELKQLLKNCDKKELMKWMLNHF